MEPTAAELEQDALALFKERKANGLDRYTEDELLRFALHSITRIASANQDWRLNQRIKTLIGIALSGVKMPDDWSL